MFKLITTVVFLITFPIFAYGVQDNQVADQKISSAVRSQSTTQQNEIEKEKALLSHAEWLKVSLAFQEASDWEGMTNWCQKWSENEPEESSAWHCRGYGHQMLHHDDDAIAAYLQTVRINPEDIAGWSNLGFVYTEQGRYNDAIYAYLKVLHIDPEDIEGLSCLLLVYSSSGNHAAAQETLQKLRRLNPEKADNFFEVIPPHK